MTQVFNKESWNVGKASGQCAGCGAVLGAGIACWAALVERPKAQSASVPAAAPAPAADASKPADDKVVSPYARVDFCEACWAAGKRPDASAGDMISFWKTLMPEPTAKRKLLVDDAVLVDLFERLEDKPEAQDVRFRFVLALILMRKRILRYEKSTVQGQGAEAREVWDMVLRGSEKEAREPRPLTVVNPSLTPEQISEVSGQLTQILAEEI